MTTEAGAPARGAGRQGDASRGRDALAPAVILIPVLAFAVIYGVNLAAPDLFDRWFRGERGLVENATALIAFAAAAVGTGKAVLLLRAEHRLMAGWALLVALACVYFGAEEISWGQHWFGWPTPDWMAALNDQGETNIHNATPFLDNGPRNLLTVGILVGGIVVPLYRRATGRAVWPEPALPIWPAFACLPTAILSHLTRLPDWIGIPAITVENGEVKELLYALFLLVYLATLPVRRVP